MPASPDRNYRPHPPLPNWILPALIVGWFLLLTVTTLLTLAQY